MTSYLPGLTIVIPLVGTIVVWAASKVSDTWADTWAAIVTGAVFAVSLAMYPTVAAGNTIHMEVVTGFPVEFSLYVDGLGLVLAIVASGLWFLSSLYAVKYMEHEHHRMRFDVFSLFSLAGMMGIVTTGNMFSFYIFFEMMAILSYLLVIHEETPEAMRAGLKYLFMGIIGGLTVLVAIVATYVITGSVDLTRGGLGALQHSPFFAVIFWSYIFGFAVKAGMFPVHVWLPDAHPVAPSPASALLSGVMIKAGAFGMIRTVYAIFGRGVSNGAALNQTLLVLALITMILGSAVAITQTEIKRLLAYSSIAQIGYVILGIAMLSAQGLIGSIYHIFGHAMMKGSLFLAAGAIIFMTGLRNIEDLRGIGKRMPVTMTAFTLAAFSMIGFPPFIGFLSKWTLAQGALDSAHNNIFALWVAVVIISALLLSSLLNVVYYGPIVIRAWFDKGPGEGHDAESHAKTKHEDPPWQMTLPIVALAAGTLVFGLFPSWIRLLAEQVAGLYFK
ncbi:MAG: monovalent cation/H+ antiporter subunit D family protein [Actinobacteria bacterium]|nr:MAG: monovalent cation/H+ antiporter subunit D family protein [Actinomycetota bacterium]